MANQFINKKTGWITLNEVEWEVNIGFFKQYFKAKGD